MFEAAKNLLLIFSALFSIADPPGGSPIFLAMTREYSASTWRALSFRIAGDRRRLTGRRRRNFTRRAACNFSGNMGLSIRKFVIAPATAISIGKQAA